MTVHEFEKAVGQICASRGSGSEGPLEPYLRALLRVFSERAGERPSYELFVELIEAAFRAEPVEFDEAWLAYTEPPDEDDPLDSVESVIQVLQFQIADLHRMAASGQLEGPYIGLGITSPSGNPWYNFDPSLYLSCGVAGVIASIEGGRMAEDRDNPTWGTFAALLELGRIYE